MRRPEAGLLGQVDQSDPLLPTPLVALSEKVLVRDDLVGDDVGGQCPEVICLIVEGRDR
jgi:hypothetical protein